MEPTEHFGIYFGYIRRLFQSWVSPFNVTPTGISPKPFSQSFFTVFVSAPSPDHLGHPSLDPESALQHNDGLAIHQHPVAVPVHGQAELAASGGALASPETVRAQLTGPVRPQHRVRRARYWVLRDAHPGREVATLEVERVAILQRDDDAAHLAAVMELL